MELYGTTSRQLGEIAVTTRRHALLNGNAMMKKPITLDDHQHSRMIADPLRLLDCSLESDGGAAVVVSAAERARDMRKRPVYVMGVAEGHPDSPSTITQRPDLTTLGTRQGRAARVRDGGRHAGGHRCRRDLRLLHLHRALPARRPRVLQEGRGRRVRRGRRARARRRAAREHARRPPVAGAHGGPEPHRRAGAPAARARAAPRRSRTPRSASSPATAISATAPSPSCGGGERWPTNPSASPFPHPTANSRSPTGTR